MESDGMKRNRIKFGGIQWIRTGSGRIGLDAIRSSKRGKMTMMITMIKVMMMTMLMMMTTTTTTTCNLHFDRAFVLVVRACRQWWPIDILKELNNIEIHVHQAVPGRVQGVVGAHALHFHRRNQRHVRYCPPVAAQQTARRTSSSALRSCCFCTWRRRIFRNSGRFIRIWLTMTSW